MCVSFCVTLNQNKLLRLHRFILNAECLVEHDYTAQEDDELSLKKGEIIKSVVTKMDGWWEGSLNGKRGMFPDNFVKVLTSNSGSADDVLASSTSEVAQMRKKPESGNHPRYCHLLSLPPHLRHSFLLKLRLRSIDSDM